MGEFVKVMVFTGIGSLLGWLVVLWIKKRERG